MPQHLHAHIPTHTTTHTFTHTHTQINNKNFRFPRKVILAPCGGWNGEAQVTRKIIGEKRNLDNRYCTGPA